MGAGLGCEVGAVVWPIARATVNDSTIITRNTIEYRILIFRLSIVLGSHCKLNVNRNRVAAVGRRQSQNMIL
jgi:hypothetical protein